MIFSKYNSVLVYIMYEIGNSYIKTHGSESRGQEEAACTRVFLAYATTTVSYLHGWQL